MVMTFILHPLSHFNTIINVFRDTATRDKFIFHLTIMRFLCHFFVSYPEPPYFPVMCVINAATVRQSKA